MNHLLRAFALSAALAAAQLTLAADAPLPPHSSDRSLGVANCTNSLCHGSAQHWTNSQVLQNEYLTWSRKDKHARAYAVLLDSRAKEIARKLGLREPAHQSSVCLDCHAHNVPVARRAEKFVISDGVTCEACHGPAQRWVRSHVEPQATHAQNRANGLYPLPDDVQRARLCLSCHFGNAEKFVNHRMLAAGHPRLIFEIDTFSQVGPVHFHIDDDWLKRKGNWDPTRAWAVGQAMAATELLKTLADPKRGRTGLFPELALFDCHACHHPMSEKREVGARREVGPGWVRLNDSSLLMLARIAGRVDAGGTARFNTQLDLLRRAVAGGEDTLEQARATMRESDQLLARIIAHDRFSSDDVRAMLGSLLEQGLAGHYDDYQSAEQATMAVQSMMDLLNRNGALRTHALQPAMSRLMASVSEDERFQPEAFHSALRELRATLQASAK
jgi:hypothetical protein